MVRFALAALALSALAVPATARKPVLPTATPAQMDAAANVGIAMTAGDMCGEPVAGWQRQRLSDWMNSHSTVDPVTGTTQPASLGQVALVAVRAARLGAQICDKVLDPIGAASIALAQLGD